MSKHVKLLVDTDMSTIGFNGNKLKLNISAKENNGLSIVNGKLVATKAPDGEGTVEGTTNTPGNGLGPTTATAETSLSKIGANSTVSRHKKYDGSDNFIKRNDGPVMVVLEDGKITAQKSIASFMIYKVRGEWIE